MTITLPDGIAERIEALAKQKGYSSIAEFLVGLVEEVENGDSAQTTSAGPPELTPKNRTDLDAMLEAAMNSGPPVRATPEFWEKRRKALEERMAKQKDGSP
jgi:hypothetical protein